MTTKIVAGPVTAVSKPVTQTSDVNNNAVPAGAAVLGSSGGQKPSLTNGQPFVTPTVPVHIDPSHQVYFYVNNQWVKPDGLSSLQGHG